TLEVGVYYDDPLIAPIAPGQPIGSVVAKTADKALSTRPLLAEHAVAPGTEIQTMLDSIRLLIGW
ncbi:MAG: serine-type D-Ala-D-Ala carboxypeptidase, partial [Magnetococcales bacterium]|nr:serine-type D-Ala-D-Ala carboxypeptidase [Magnetococcales bacterium]